MRQDDDAEKHDLGRLLGDLKRDLSDIGRRMQKLETDEWKKGWIEGRFDLIYHMLEDLKP